MRLDIIFFYNKNILDVFSNVNTVKFQKRKKAFFFWIDGSQNKRQYQIGTNLIVVIIYYGINEGFFT